MYRPQYLILTPLFSPETSLSTNPNHLAQTIPTREALDSSPPYSKLPLIVYFHGGGFAVLSAASTIFNTYCLNLAAGLPAVVVSVEYRLAPEHRLPAAYDDAVDALRWIGTAGDDFLRSYAYLSNCFLMGDSAGGNIDYQVGLRSAAEVECLRPVRIRRVILQQPFFGGVQRSGSELRLVNDHMARRFVSLI